MDVVIWTFIFLNLVMDSQGKATSVDSSVSSGKTIIVIVDKLYPTSPTFSITFKKEGTDISIPGSKTCSSSTQFSGYYRCTWSSSNSISYGLYAYNLVVTTVTQSDPLTGTFNIVSPGTPVISNTDSDNTGDVLRGNEGQSLTIECTSAGGFPAPTLAWYKESVSTTNRLAQPSSGTLQSDGTYTVTLKHTLSASSVVTLDREQLICRSYYPDADSDSKDSKQTNALLYLNKMPKKPTVTQVTTGVRCVTTGSRPAASISWIYQGTTIQGDVTPTIDSTTETYTVESIYRISAQDNGKSIQCIVTHQTLTNPLKTTLTLDVKFAPSSVYISGNREFTATAKDTLTLTCTTASSNPGSDIAWKNGTKTLTNNLPKIDTIGANNGVVRSQSLVLVPTWYMDGDSITCSASYAVSQNPITDTAILNLNYIASDTEFYIDGNLNKTSIIVDEHDRVQFTCTVNTNPPPVITILYEGNVVKGSSEIKVLSFNRNYVDCFDAGVYTCETSFSGHEAILNITLRVNCSPRPLRQTSNNVTGELNEPITLGFTAVAYPEPGPKGFLWFKEEGMRWSPLRTNEDISISSSELQSNLTVLNVSSTSYGQYRVTVINRIGSYEQYMFLSSGEQSSIFSCPKRNEEHCDCAQTTLVVGLSLGIVCTALAVYIGYLTICNKRMYRKNKSPDTIEKDDATNCQGIDRLYANQAYIPGNDVDEVNEYEQTDQSTYPASGQYTELKIQGEDDKSAYETLQL